MDISFIIVNYKSFQYLDKCLASIIESSRDFNFEIIIVNNDQEKLGKITCFDKNCLEIIEFEVDGKKSKKPEIGSKVVILEINKNIGFGRANNIGILHSRGKYICFINPDVQIKSKSIVNIINEFESNPKTGIIGPKIIQKIDLNGVEVIQEWSVGVDPSLKELLFSKIGLSKSIKISKSDNKIEVDWVTGACLFIRKRIFLEVGGFDENFFLYFEDIDLCKKTRVQEKKIIYLPQFKVLHLGGKSSASKYQQKIEYFKSQDYFYKKWSGGLSYWIVKFMRFFYFWRYKV